jgi:hypothetical protein
MVHYYGVRSAASHGRLKPRFGWCIVQLHYNHRVPSKLRTLTSVYLRNGAPTTGWNECLGYSISIVSSNIDGCRGGRRGIDMRKSLMMLDAFDTLKQLRSCIYNVLFSHWRMVSFYFCFQHFHDYFNMWCPSNAQYSKTIAVTSNVFRRW